jgi:hypothetical protein
MNNIELLFEEKFIFLNRFVGFLTNKNEIVAIPAIEAIVKK